MRVGDNPAEADICANGAVIRPLGARIPVVWPAEWPTRKLTVVVDEGVLLLDAVHGFFFQLCVPNGHGKVPKIGV